MARLNIPRMAALALGAKTYLGPPCAHGHAGTRHTANGACVMCAASRKRSSVQRIRLRLADEEQGPGEATTPWLCSYLAIYHEQDFDRAGWKRALPHRYEYEER